jgi:cytochrome c553
MNTTCAQARSIARQWISSMKFGTVAMMIVYTLFGANKLIAEEAISPELRDAALRVAVGTCATCHGPQGRSISPKFPRLAGQNAGYITAQMKNFKARTRADADAIGYMWGMAAPLDDDLIAALAAYYSAQRPAAGEALPSDEIARGKQIFAEGLSAAGVPACIACHGANAVGTAQFPRLAGQSAQYLLKQLRAFQNNMRDVAVMHGVTASLKPDQMIDVAAYLQSLGP